MSLKRRLATASGLSALDTLVRLAAVLLISPFLLAQLGKEGYGFWVLLLSVAAYLELLDFGIAQTAVRYLSRAFGRGDADAAASLFAFFRRFYRRAALAALALTGLAWLAAPAFASSPETLADAREILLVLGFSQALVFALRIHAVLLRAHLLYARSIGAGLVRLLLFNGGILLVLPSRPDAATLAWLHAAALLAEQVLLVFLARPERAALGAASVLPPGEAREIAGFSGKVLGWSVASFLRERVDTQILAAFVSTAAVAHYAVGSRFLQLFTDLVNAVFGGQFLAAFAQVHAREGRDGATGQLLATLRLSVPLALGAGTAIYLLGSPFVERWLGPGFEESHFLIRLLALPLALTLMQYPLGPYLGSQNKHGAMALVSLVGGGLNLAASLVLVRFLGFPGVVLATAAELAVTALVFWPWIAARRGGINLGAYLGALAGPALRLLPAVLGSFALVRLLVAPSYTALVLCGTAVGALFAANAWLLLLSREERGWVWAVALRR